MISLLICAFLFKGSLCYDDGYGTYGPPGAPSPIGGAPGSDQVGQLNSGFFQTGWKSQYTGPYYFKGQNSMYNLYLLPHHIYHWTWLEF